MSWLREKFLKIILALLFIGGAIWFNFGSSINLGFSPLGPHYETREGVSEVMTSTTAQPPRYALHILFIGNSFTFYHDIPRQLVDLASNDPGNETQFIVQSVTRGGISLKEEWEDGIAAATIKSMHWDYIVLQQRSSWALNEVETTTDYVERFDKLIKENGAKTLLYLTWVNKPGSHWYTDEGIGGLSRDPDYMLNKFILHTQKLSDEIGAQTVYVGIYWQYILARYPEIELYDADGHHPSLAGSYLSALTFYSTLTGRDITKIPFRPGGISADEDAKIKGMIVNPQ